jgi:U4/U6 small nuclear ribonucleoprotein PRP3
MLTFFFAYPEGASDAMEIDEPKKKKEKVIIPVVEWWDAPWIEGENYDIILDDKINNLIDHPVLLEPPAEKQGGGPLPLMLTPAERKRLKKQMKAEQMKEMQDKVLLGLATPPGPRVRISNMVRVLGAEAILDPTSIEKAVRKEMAARERRHEERNAERKLTPEQRKEKKIAKLKEDTSLQSIVAVFKVNSVADPRLRFKVDINAQQNYLTGCCVTSPSFSLIVVEGGPKAIRKYKKLMMRRVNWNIKPEGQEDDDDEDDPKAGPNNCHIVWEGEVLRPTFRNFRFEAYPNEAAARKWLQDSGVAHYWDMAEKVGTGSI